MWTALKPPVGGREDRAKNDGDCGAPGHRTGDDDPMATEEVVRGW